MEKCVFFLQVTALSMMLLVGIFLGIDSAERNIQEMEGTRELPGRFISPRKTGAWKSPCWGRFMMPKPPPFPGAEQVKEEIREAAASGKNLLGQVGNQVGHGIRLGTRKALEMVVGWLEPGK